MRYPMPVYRCRISSYFYQGYNSVDNDSGLQGRALQKQKRFFIPRLPGQPMRVSRPACHGRDISATDLIQ